MTNKEILAELKKSYEYLTDIRENGCYDHCCGQIKNKIDKLDIARGYIEEIYFDFYKTLDKEELRVEQIERKVGGDKVYISNYVSSDYLIDSKVYDEECGGISYITCCDLDYYWYEDRDFIESWCEE